MNVHGSPATQTLTLLSLHLSHRKLLNSSSSSMEPTLPSSPAPETRDRHGLPHLSQLLLGPMAKEWAP